jgi:23S rRNA (uracil1939-C5)-methyltransferase
MIQGSAALASVEILPLRGTKQPLFWRTSLKIPVARQGGRIRSGFFEPGSHRIVDLETCVVQHPILVELVHAVRAGVRQYRVPPYDETRHEGVLRHLVARVGAGSEEVLAGLVVRVAGHAGIRRLARALLQEFAGSGLVGVLENVNPERTNVIAGKRSQTLCGRHWMLEEADGLLQRTSLFTFSQVNNAQARVLYREVLRALEPIPGKRIVELYAGSGPIGLRLAKAGAQVVAVERDAAAVEEGEEAAQLNAFSERLRFVAADAQAAFPAAAAQGVDAVVVDPPRRGLPPGLIETLCTLRVPQLLYVSCNPKTLFRDLEALQPAYRVRSLRPVDLFPRMQTLEVVAHLERLPPG